MDTTDKMQRHIASGSAFMVLLLLAVAAAPAQAGEPGLYQPPEPQPFAASRIAPLSADCLNETGGSFQVGAVNVGGQADFYIIIAEPAPEGGVVINITSDNPGVVAPVDISTGGAPTLFVPEGRTVTTRQFRQIGNAVGRATLDIAATPSVHPDTGTVLSFSVPVSGWDVGDAQKRFIDANAPGNHCRVSDSDPALSTDGNRLANCGNSDITSVATDGVTPILMRLKTGLSGQGCFRVISNAPPAQGTISAGVVNTQAVGGLEQAFSFYYPPDEFADTAATRTVDVEFTYTPIVAGKRASTTRFRDTLTLVRPPVVLMHGLWADEKSWEDDFIDNVKSSDEVVVVGDYKDSNAESLTENRAVASKSINEAIEKAREQDIALTQVDYIGHSMGGLLGRLHMSGRDYRKPENLDQGDIRRFVSLNTPHFGTNLANLLIALRSDAGTRDRIARDVAAVIGYGGSTGQSGLITEGAICDLAENSAGLGQLRASVPMAHVFSGTGGHAGGVDSPAQYWDSFLAGLLGYELFEDRFTETRCVDGTVILGFCTGTRVPVYPQAIVDAFRFREGNDLIVPASSQRGGIAPGAVTNDAAIHHFASAVTDSFLESAGAGADVRRILDAAASSPLLAALAPVSSLANGVSRSVPGQGELIDAAAFSSVCAPGGSMNPLMSTMIVATAAAVQAFDPGIRIVSPTEGQVFEPGDTFNVLVEITDPSFLSVVEGSIPYIGAFSDEEAPYELTVTVPERASGKLEVKANGLTYDGSRFFIHDAQPVTIIVRRSTPPDRLSVEESEDLRIPSPWPELKDRVSVKGIYDGVEVDLNPSVTGTTYVSSDTNIVTVDSEGVLTAVAHGRAVITTENMGVKAFTMVRVGDSRGLLPPEEVTYKLDIQRSGIRLNRRTGFFTQRVTITNPTDLPIPGSLALLLEGLTPGVTAVNRTTSSDRILPGSPQFDIPTKNRLHSLMPGATVTFDIEFLNPNRERIRYTPRVFIARDF